jgi:hypothetical protein
MHKAVSSPSEEIDTNVPVLHRIFRYNKWIFPEAISGGILTHAPLSRLVTSFSALVAAKCSTDSPQNGEYVK